VPLNFSHSLGVMWFCPPPKPEYVVVPRIEDFGLVEVGDPEDLSADIVFDC